MKDDIVRKKLANIKKELVAARTKITNGRPYKIKKYTKEELKDKTRTQLIQSILNNKSINEKLRKNYYAVLIQNKRLLIETRKLLLERRFLEGSKFNKRTYKNLTWRTWTKKVKTARNK